MNDDHSGSPVFNRFARRLACLTALWLCGCGGVGATQPDPDAGTPVDLAAPVGDAGARPDLAGCSGNGQCGAGKACCGGMCTDLNADDRNCGACGTVCGPGKACCNGSCTDTTSDPFNCGGCRKGCDAIAHAKATCAAGACALASCQAGWGDCDKDPANGCESNLRSDARNCTACGMTCTLTNGIPGCSDGCYLKGCNFGFDDCNGDPKDGCETPTLSDPKNCGGCGTPCKNLPNAQVACQSATCVLLGCSVGFADCDKQAANGCEQNVQTDANNCGACGNVCPQGLICKGSQCTCPNCNIPNASSKCLNNVCMLDKCNPGYADCDGNAQNGCESFVAGDPKNCGGCGMTCPQNQNACVNAKCTSSPCIGNPQWQRVSCTTQGWVWSRDKGQAITVQAAAAAKVLATGCKHGQPQPDLGNGVCSLDGTGWVSTTTFIMSGCNNTWYHLGGSYTGACGGHDGDVWRHLVLTDNDCYPY